MADFLKIKAEYIRDEQSSYRSLAEKYGVPFSAVRRHADAEKWRELRAKSKQKTSEKIVEKISRQGASRADMFDKIADKLLKMISDGIDDGSITVSGRGYRDVTGALKDLREIKGLKSDLDMQEQIARIEKLRKDAEKDVVADESTYGVLVLPEIIDDAGGEKQ